MADTIRKTVIGCGLAGLLTLAPAVPALAQVVVVDPYYYGSPYGAYAGPYGRFVYPGSRYWDYPAGYDTGGAPYSFRDLGWQPGFPGAAPANPCNPGQREQNRC